MMYIPNVSSNPAYRPYIFKLREYRVARFDEAGRKLIMDRGTFRLEDEERYRKFATIEEVISFFNVNKNDFWLEGFIEDKWIDLRHIEIVYELQNV